MNLNKRWLLLTIAALLAVSATVSLGFWQLRRAAQKNAMQTAMKQGASGVELTSAALNAATDLSSLQFQPAALTGQWLTERTVFLDNRQMHDRVGFYVVTPLRLASNRVILVYRGWVARNFLDRSALPSLPLPPGQVTVHGRIAPAPGKLFEPGAPSHGTIRQNLDIALFSTEAQLPLLPVVFMQTGNTGDGLLREWPVADVGIEKHYGYAAQWFAIAALVIALYCWFQLLQPYLRRTQESATHVQ